MTFLQAFVAFVALPVVIVGVGLCVLVVREILRDTK